MWTRELYTLLVSNSISHSSTERDIDPLETEQILLFRIYFHLPSWTHISTNLQTFILNGKQLNTITKCYCTKGQEIPRVYKKQFPNILQGSKERYFFSVHQFPRMKYICHNFVVDVSSYKMY